MSGLIHVPEAELGPDTFFKNITCQEVSGCDIIFAFKGYKLNEDF